MSLQRHDVEKIAHLARLAIDEQQIPEYASELSAILELVEQLSDADTTDVLPMAHPLDAVQRLREDKVTEVDGRERFQPLAPQTDGGVYLVPKVID